jgi:MoxR-like ATPase
MTLEQELEETLGAAGRHARPGEKAVAVMATEPGADGRVYVVALAAGDELAYVALDAKGASVSDARVVKDAVALAALAERAEEVSGATVADELAERFGEAAQRLREQPAGAAADAVVAAARRLEEAAEGPRVATPVYLDRLAALAAGLAEALDAFVPLAEQLPDAAGGAAGPPPPREVAVAALSVAARAGDPANFAQAMTAASGAVDALVADVVDHYRGPLVGA